MKKISDEIAKKNNKKKINKIIHTILTILIGYPLVYPYYKAKDFIKSKQDKYWGNHTDNLYKKSFKEMVAYINKELTIDYKCDQYCVYNSRRTDEIHFSNAFYLKHFIGWGLYNQKKNKISSEYYKIMTDSKREIKYDEIFSDLQKYFKSSYSDIDITEGEEPSYKGGQKYFKIKFKV